MKIAYLILCHTDPAHIARLARKLTVDAPDSHVFVHLDAKSAQPGDFEAAVRQLARVTLLDTRVPVWWGGASAIDATHLLLREAFSSDTFERFVLLQGADYPLMSNADISAFFERRADTEFIRACNATQAQALNICAKSRHRLFYDRPNMVKKLANKITRVFDLRLRDGRVALHGRRCDIYWGCAQFALTRACVEHLLSHVDDAGLRRQFDTIFPADELYFHTLVFNSAFASRTVRGGAEPDVTDLGDTRALHYFEYPSLVRIFTAADDRLLAARPEMFVRKVNSQASAGLLDLIDARHGAGDPAGATSRAIAIDA